MEEGLTLTLDGNEHLEKNFWSDDKVTVLSHIIYSEPSHGCEVYGMSVRFKVKAIATVVRLTMRMLHWQNMQLHLLPRYRLPALSHY